MDLHKITSIQQTLFGEKFKLLPSVSEMFELELANLEHKSLKKNEYLARTAFCESINNNYSKHFLLYSQTNESLHEGRSFETKAYFEEGQYSTGYATHGLFPYRGKFHPQLIKGILNAMDMKPGDRVLDPMMGSGTTLVEAVLMGINAVGCDVSPFCRFMAEAKLDGFTVSVAPL